MSSPPVVTNRQSWRPAISESPTPEETALHTRLLYNATNDHDQAITLLKAQLSAAKGGSTTIIQNVTANSSGGGPVSPISGLGGVNNQTGQTAYTIQNSDNGVLVVLSNAAPVAVTLNSAVQNPYLVFFTNLGAGLVTFTPSSGTITGPSTLPLNYTAIAVFDGVNWWTTALPIVPQNTPAVVHQWLNAYNSTTGAFTQTQPAFSDLSGTATYAQIPTFPYTAQTANYTVAAFDYQIECTANSFTVTLPTAVGVTGRVYSIKNSGTGTITVATTSAQTIDGSTTQTLTQFDNLVVMSNGTGWIIL